MSEKTQTASIPMRSVGPVVLSGPELQAEVMVPLATFETPLWPSVARGARVSRHCGGIRAVVLGECMTRSVLLTAPGAVEALDALRFVQTRRDELVQVTVGTSRFAHLRDIHGEVIGNLLFLRFSLFTGDAAGHNMVTRAAEAMLEWVLSQCPDLRYGSISGNLCTDKKVSAINGILGRGRSVVAEMTISAEVCQARLRTDPRELVDLNVRKNLVGSIAAGSVRSANAHAANMLLAFYLATGQDAANIVEGSQAITYAELREQGLYFSCTLPNLVLGTVGNGKDGSYVRANLEQLGCTGESEPGVNARRLAVIAAATVLCGELSLLAAQTHPGELMRAHVGLERRH